IAQTGLSPSHDIPAANVTQCCSAMPTSNERSGNLSSAVQTPVPSGIAAVNATTVGSFSKRRNRPQLFFHLVFEAMITMRAANSIQVAGQRADCRRDRHLIVVEQDDQTALQMS